MTRTKVLGRCFAWVEPGEPHPNDPIQEDTVLRLVPVGWLLVIGASATGAAVAGIGTLTRARLRRRLRRRAKAA